MNHFEKNDQRWSQRQGISLDIVLQKDDQPLLKTTSRDISFGGILIDADTTGLDIDHTLNVEFSLRNAHGVERHSLPARVVRHHAHGTALAFSDYDIPALDALRILLYDGNSSH